MLSRLPSSDKWKKSQDKERKSPDCTTKKPLSYLGICFRAQLIWAIVIFASATLVPQPIRQKPDTNAFAYERDRPFNLKEAASRQESGVTIRDVNYEAYNPAHKRIEAYIVEPNSRGRFAGVVFFHWLGNSKSDRTEFLNEAVALAKRGTVSVLLQGFFPWFEPPTEADADRRQVIDQTIEVRRAIDLLLSLPEVDSKRIAFVGHDYGAMFGAIIAGVERRVGAYVLMAGAPNFSDWSLKYWPNTAASGAEHYKQVMSSVDPIRYVSRAAPATILFQFSTDDKFITNSAAKAFWDAASKPKDIKWYDAKHNLEVEVAVQDRLAWLTKQLRLTKPT